MSPDIHAVTSLLKEEKIWLAVKNHIEYYNDNQVLYYLLTLLLLLLLLLLLSGENF